MSIQWMALLGSLTSCCPGQKRKLQFFFLSPDADSPVWGRKTATGLVFHWCPSAPGDGSSAAGLCFLSHSPLSWCPRSPSPPSKFLLLVCPKARGNIWVFGIGSHRSPVSIPACFAGSWKHVPTPVSLPCACSQILTCSG